jgi:hypothetical protein
LPSPALKAWLQTTETAVASDISELSVTETKLTEAKKKHRDLLNDNIVLPHTLEGEEPRNAGTSSGGDCPQGGAEQVLVLSGRKDSEAGPGPEADLFPSPG